MATKVNTAALMRPVRSVLKFNNPIARPPRTTVNCNHERNVRSFAKKTKTSALSDLAHMRKEHEVLHFASVGEADERPILGVSGQRRGRDLLVLREPGERYGSLEKC